MATSTAPVWEPDWATPPGDVLLEVLKERGMTQAELARRMARPLKTVNEIVKGKTVITAETAIQLERTLGISARFWNNLESNYREANARLQARAQLEKEADWADRFPVKALQKYGIIRGAVSKADVVAQLLGFFGVGSTAAWEKTWVGATAAFRASQSHVSSLESVAAWLRCGEIQAAWMTSEPYSPARFRQALSQIRRLTAMEPIGAAIEQTTDLCARSGVVVVVTPELPKARLSGACRWLATGRVLIQLSLRYKSDDQFWFTLFHEAGHVLATSRRRDFIDTLDDGSGDEEAERIADDFARDYLVPLTEYETLVHGGNLTEDTVRSFALALGITPGIVVARLQRDGYLDHSRLNWLKSRINLMPLTSVFSAPPAGRMVR